MPINVQRGIDTFNRCNQRSRISFGTAVRIALIIPNVILEVNPMFTGKTGSEIEPWQKNTNGTVKHGPRVADSPCYERSPERATPDTVSEALAYRSTFEEFVNWIDDPGKTLRDITSQIADEYAQHMRTLNIAVSTHNRKLYY